MKKIFFIVPLFVIFGYCLQEVSDEMGEGGKAAAYLKSPVGARAIALGGNFVAIANNPSLCYWNPAGIPQIYEMQLEISHSLMSLDRTHSFIGFVYPEKDFAVSLIHAGVGSISGYDQYNTPTGNFSENNFLISFSMAKLLTEDFLIGGNIKILMSFIKDYSAFGHGIDFGMLFSLMKDLKAGIMFQDIFTQLYWDTGHSDRADFLIRAAVSYTLLEGKFLLTGGIGRSFWGKKIKLSAGAEFRLVYDIFLRSGISENLLSAGFGYKYKFCSIDYSYKVDKFMVRDNHSLSLTFSF